MLRYHRKVCAITIGCKRGAQVIIEAPMGSFSEQIQVLIGQHGYHLSVATLIEAPRKNQIQPRELKGGMLSSTVGMACRTSLAAY